jgi:hypothetical protein
MNYKVDQIKSFLEENIVSIKKKNQSVPFMEMVMC